MSQLDETYQMMIVNAACHAITMNQESDRIAIYEKTRPHVILRARIFPDGNQWCCLYGDNIQEGVAGFGDTPAKAAAAFDHAWEHSENVELMHPTQNDEKSKLTKKQ